MPSSGQRLGTASRPRGTQWLAGTLLSAAAAMALPADPAAVSAPDRSGVLTTFNANGPLDQSGPFFTPLGRNGRSCATCHVLGQAMSFTPAHARQRFDATGGSDPLFAAVDGGNCPQAVAGDREAHSLILASGLIRIALTVPTGAEYGLSPVSDPYGCALEAASGALSASVYRRPLPAANLRFLSAVMFDGRETLLPVSNPATVAANLRADLAHQVIDAALIHGEASQPPDDATVQAIVAFELGIYSAQSRDARAGMLDSGGGGGGPFNLASQPYYPGINDSLGADPRGLAFDPESMRLFTAWRSQPGAQFDRDDGAAARADIAAGEDLFGSLPIAITNVRGLNDNAALGRPAVISGHCSTCHDTPAIGNHSLPLPLDIGTSHSDDPSFEPDPAIAAAVRELRGARLPLFAVSGCPSPFAPGTPVSFYTTDPGRALITGHCADLNRFKGPVLRGLAARAPYFHNGAAASLMEVVNFYDKRFSMGLTELQKRQLVAFLSSL